MKPRSMILLEILFILCAAPASGAEPDVKEIVRRSVQKNERNWRAAPQYTFIERDVVTEDGKVSRRAYKVLMMCGSPYEQLIAENEEPLSAARAAEEQKKMEEEIARRNHESAAARRRRIETYERNREQEHALMQEMGNAFEFKLIGQEWLNGYNCYVLDAQPRPGYRPTNNETKVLTGMRGKMWIDTQEFQWVKVQAEVFQPVAFGLFVAHVRPGTEFTLEQAPVDQDVWLPLRLITKVHATALLIWSKNYTRTETYSNYSREEPAQRAATP